MFRRVHSPISVGPACRAGLRGHAATSDHTRRKEQQNVAVERTCAPGRFALRPIENPFRQKGPTKHSPFWQKGLTLTIIRDGTLSTIECDRNRDRTRLIRPVAICHLARHWFCNHLLHPQQFADRPGLERAADRTMRKIAVRNF